MTARRSARWLAPALPLVAFGILFWAPFVYDDPGFIAHNALVVGPWPGWRAFFLGSYFLGEYEPLNFLLHRALWAWGGAGVLVYRLSSLAVHLANGWLAYRVYRKLLNAPVTAWWAAVLVVLYPGHAEVLAVSVFKKHLLVAFFALAALNAQASSLPNGARRALAWLCCAAAFGCRESAAMIPLLSAALAWCRGSWRKDRALVWGQAATAAAYAAFRLTLVPRHLQPILEPSLAAHVLTCGKALLWDLGQLVIPTSVCLEHGLGAVPALGWQAAAVAAAAAALAAGCWALCRADRVAGFGAVWTLIALFPTLGLVPFANYSLVANRYLYLASFGFYLLWARLALRWVQPRLSSTRWSRVTPILVAAATTVGSLRAAALFCDPVGLWAHAARCAPSNPRAHGEYARALQAAGRLADSETEYKKALALDPNYLWAYVGLSSLYGTLGRSEDAVAAARERVAREADADGWFSLAMALAGGGRFTEARPDFEKAVALSPSEPRFRYYLGACDRDLGLDARARREWETAAGSYDPAIRERAAQALASLGHF